MSELFIVALLLVAAGLVAVALTRPSREIAARKRAEAQRDRLAHVVREVYTEATQIQATVEDPLAAYVITVVKGKLSDEERLEIDVR